MFCKQRTVLTPLSSPGKNEHDARSKISLPILDAQLASSFLPADVNFYLNRNPPCRTGLTTRLNRFEQNRRNANISRTRTHKRKTYSCSSPKLYESVFQHSIHTDKITSQQLVPSLSPHIRDFVIKTATTEVRSA